MNKHEKEDLIRALWQKHGVKLQLIKAVEELSELQKEILKALGSMESGREVPIEILRNIAEEKEDVKFMMEQLDLMYVEPVYLSMNEKLNKLASMVREKAPVKEEKIRFPNHDSFKNTYAHLGTDENGKKFWEEGYVSPEIEDKNEKVVNGKTVIKSMYEKYNTHDGLAKFINDWETAFDKPQNNTTDKTREMVIGNFKFRYPVYLRSMPVYKPIDCPVCFYPLTENHKCDLDNLSKY